MPKRRAGSAAALLADGRMMVIGGYTEEGIAQGLLASCDVFDPTTGLWSEDGCAPLSRARWGHGCAVLQERVYVVGGCSLQLEAQAQEAFMVTLRHCASQLFSSDNKLEELEILEVSVGFIRLLKEKDTFFMQNRCLHCLLGEIYLPHENRWVPTGALQIARSGTRVVALGAYDSTRG